MEPPNFFWEGVGGLKVNHNDYGGGALGLPPVGDGVSLLENHHNFWGYVSIDYQYNEKQ